MKLTSNRIRCAVAVALLVTVAWTANAADDATPMIEMENVPLSEAIRNVSRQMELNYIIDPRLLSTGGGLLSNPPITVRWRNITLQQALERLLTEQKLAIVTNSVTTVARIVPKDAVVGSVSASAIGKDTNGVIAVLSINDPLAEAIRTIAGRAQIKVSFAPETAQVFVSADVFRSEVTIEYRWKNITARQALAALLDNYGLVMTEDPVASAARITLRPKNDGKK